jgi:hypothetical protein
MRDDLGFLRILLQDGQKESGQSHGFARGFAKKEDAVKAD